MSRGMSVVGADTVLEFMKPTGQQRLKLTGWFLPLAYSAASLSVGLVFPRMDHHLWPGLVSTMNAASAMAICSAIA